MAHTPGPWSVLEAQRGYIITNADNTYDIAVVRNIGNHDNESNARLIAAAPKLLEFAKYWLSRQGSERNYMTGMARAAIAKATGCENE